MRGLLGIAILILGCAASSLALQPSDVAIVCNSKVAAGVQLAHFYAQSRHIPETNIIELPLPDTETMPAELFDPQVITPIRAFLNERKLRVQIKCIVTMYGVPLTLASRQNTEMEAQELAELKTQQTAVLEAITKVVVELEDAVKRKDKKFQPAKGGSLTELVARFEAAKTRGGQLLNELGEPSDRQQLFQLMIGSVEQLYGPSGIVRQIKTADPNSAEGKQLADMRTRVQAALAEGAALLPQRHLFESRQRLMELTRDNFGLIELAQLFASQIDYLTPSGNAAFDSELAMLWVDVYQHKDFIPNPLVLRSKAKASSPVIMVSRLDGPQSGTAKDIIMACKSVESEGRLPGTFAVDSRGLQLKTGDAKQDGYAPYDQRLRELVNLVRKHTKMSVLSDDAPETFRPNTARDISLYCGWYSVRKYIPSFTFVPGAVAWHVGSYECMSLHNAGEPGWCRGLLNDGVAATMGPVDEPFLFSFPDPVEFYGLLLTGRFTLAETYWLTSPTVSWRMVLIGDPLYNPFARQPALKTEDLPEDIRKYLPAAAPAE